MDRLDIESGVGNLSFCLLFHYLSTYFDFLLQGREHGS